MSFIRLTFQPQNVTIKYKNYVYFSHFCRMLQGKNVE